MSACKRCIQCKAVLPLESFGRRAAAKDGRHYYCKECARVRVARSRSRRPDTYLTYGRAQKAAAQALIVENRDRYEVLLEAALKRERAIAAIVGVRDVPA